MERKEEIIQRAKEAEKETAFYDIVFEAKGVNSMYGIGFLEGCVWADQHPRKGLVDIENACQKLEKCMYDNLMFQGRLHRKEVIETFIEDFKKYVEEHV